jgi:ribosomal protein L9
VKNKGIKIFLMMMNILINKVFEKMMKPHKKHRRESMKKKELEKQLEEEKERADILHNLYLRKRAECNGRFKAAEYVELLDITEQLEKENIRLARENVELVKDITALSRILQHNLWNY